MDPWYLRPAARTRAWGPRTEEDPMRLSRTLALGASMLVLFSACSTGGGSKPTIKIGSDGFDEARVVAEVYAQVLEANGYTVDRAGIGLGARKVTAAALESGQIDLKPEYIGSGLGLLRRDRLERSGQEPGGPSGQADLGRRGNHGLRLHAGPGHERPRRDERRQPTPQPHEMERPDGGRRRPQVGPRHGLPDEPGLRRRRSRTRTESTPRRST